MTTLMQGTDPTLLSMQNKIIERSSLVEFKRGAVVTEYGSAGIEVLIISSGVLGVWDRSEPTKEMRLAYPAWRNSALNISDALTGRANYQVTALARSNVYRLKHDAVSELWRDRHFVEWLLWAMSRNHAMLTTYNVATRFKSVPERIISLIQAAYLQINGTWPSGSFEMDWPIRGGDFAEMLGISRPYLHSTLVALEIEGRLTIGDNKLKYSKSEPARPNKSEPAKL